MSDKPVTNKKLELLDALLNTGQITQEMYDQNKANILSSIKDVAQNIEAKGGFRKAVEFEKPIQENLGQVVSSIKSRGGYAPNMFNEVKTVGGEITKAEKGLNLINKVPKFKKLMAVLPVLGTGLAAMGITENAMAGEYGKAGAEAADLATDYIPVVSQAKMALMPESIGKTPESEAIENPNSEAFKKRVQLEAIQRMKK